MKTTAPHPLVSLPAPDPAKAAQALAQYQRLLAEYGPKPRVRRREPMHELISTMLSHRTNAKNEDEAYRALFARFETWEGIRDAAPDAVIEAIRPSNYPEVKGPNIQAVIARVIAEQGAANIDFLDALPLDRALAWLLSLPGVGIKTATLVLLFAFGKPVFPVDTHVHRIAGRTGLIGPKVSAEAAHTALLALLPPDPDVLYGYHRHLLTHGQRVCLWNIPRCSACVLKDLCAYYATPGLPRT
jgi:endonuclease-3